MGNIVLRPKGVGSPGGMFCVEKGTVPVWPGLLFRCFCF